MQDYLVETPNPKALDATLNQMGAMLAQNADSSYVKDKNGHYQMRVVGDAGYVEFAIKSQGYGKIIQKL